MLILSRGDKRRREVLGYHTSSISVQNLFYKSYRQEYTHPLVLVNMPN